MSYTQVPPNSTGNKIDTVTVTDGSDTVHRQVVSVGDPTTTARIMAVNADGSVPVTGTFYQATQPVSAASLPLPTGASTETTLSSINTKTPSLGQATMANSSPVVLASNQSTVPVDDIGISKSGTISALNGTVVLNMPGDGGAAFDIRGAFTATVTFQGTIDGTNFFSLVATPVASAANVATVTTATAAGAWYVQCAGCTQIRAIATAYTSGTITATIRSIQTMPWVYSAPVGATNAVSGTVTATVTGGTFLPVTPTQSFINSAATTNATSVKASAGTVWSIICSNANAAARYVKFYNLAVAPTVGTSVPAFTIAIPASSTIQITGGSNGIRFGTGIALAITTGIADADTGAVAANEIKVATSYT